MLRFHNSSFPFFLNEQINFFQLLKTLNEDSKGFQLIWIINISTWISTFINNLILRWCNLIYKRVVRPLTTSTLLQYATSVYNFNIQLQYTTSKLVAKKLSKSLNDLNLGLFLFFKNNYPQTGAKFPTEKSNFSSVYNFNSPKDPLQYSITIQTGGLHNK